MKSDSGIVAWWSHRWSHRRQEGIVRARSPRFRSPADVQDASVTRVEQAADRIRAILESLWQAPSLLRSIEVDPDAGEASFSAATGVMRLTGPQAYFIGCGLEGDYAPGGIFEKDAGWLWGALRTVGHEGAHSVAAANPTAAQQARSDAFDTPWGKAAAEGLAELAGERSAPHLAQRLGISAAPVRFIDAVHYPPYTAAMRHLVEAASARGRLTEDAVLGDAIRRGSGRDALESLAALIAGPVRTLAERQLAARPVMEALGRLQRAYETVDIDAADFDAGAWAEHGLRVASEAVSAVVQRRQLGQLGDSPVAVPVRGAVVRHGF